MSAPDSVLLVLRVDAVSEFFRLDELSDECAMLPTPPLPTWYTGAIASCCLISLWSSSSNEKIARSELWWTLPAPPRPDLNVLGCDELANDALEDVLEVEPHLEPEADLTTLPAPPREVWMYGLVACGCGSAIE